ncbi:NATT3 protein, partial [Polypterus senegalus]
MTFLLLSDVCSDSASMASPPKNLENITKAPEAEAEDLSIIPVLKEVAPPSHLNSNFMLWKASAQQRSLDTTSLFGSTINLQWVPFKEVFLNDMVSIWNSYESRTDYVCKVKCEPGFYNPINRDKFEFLEWVSGSYGSFPALAVIVCEGYDVLIGKNKYGLGKILPKQSSFYLPWEGYEYTYYYYDVLSINKGSYSQEVTNVMYDTNQAKFLELPPELLMIYSLDNYMCQSVNKTVTHWSTTADENYWDIQCSTIYGDSMSFTAGIPELISGSVSVSTEKTFTTTFGKTSDTSNCHPLSVNVTLKPNQSCKIKILEKKVTATVPFTARLSRTYWNGNRASTTVVGQYHGVQVMEGKPVIEKCEQIPNAQPCPSE